MTLEEPVGLSGCNQVFFFLSSGISFPLLLLSPILHVDVRNKH